MVSKHSKALTKVIVENVINLNAVSLTQALAACGYNLNLFVEAVTESKKNNGNETIYTVLRSGLSIADWKKIGEATVGGTEKLLVEEIVALRRSGESSSSPGAALFPGDIMSGLRGVAATNNATEKSLSLQHVLSQIVCIDDASIVAGSGKQKLVGANANISFTRESNLTNVAQCLPGAAVCVAHVTQCKTNSATQGSGEDVNYNKNLASLCTVRGFQEFTSLGSNYKFPHELGDIDAYMAFGYQKGSDFTFNNTSTSQDGAYTLIVRGNSAGPNTAANNGVCGTGWFTSIMTNPNNAAITTAGATGFIGTNAALVAANQARMEANNDYSAGVFTSGYTQTELDVLSGLTKRAGDFTAERLLTMGYHLSAITGAGFKADAEELKADRNANQYLTVLYGYTASSGIWYDGPVLAENKVTFSKVFGLLHAAGYSLSDLKAQSTILTSMKTHDVGTQNAAGYGVEAVAQFYDVDDVDTISEFGGYATIAAMLNGLAALGADQAAINTFGNQYVRPLLTVFRKKNTQQMIDLVMDLNAKGLNFTQPSLTTGGDFQNNWTVRDLAGARLTCLAGNATDAESAFFRYALANLTINDPEGLAKERSRFAKWVVPSNHNDKNHNQVRFTSAVPLMESGDLPTDDYYGLFGAHYQQHVYYYAGDSYGLIPSMSWDEFYKTDAGYMPAQVYAKDLEAAGVPKTAWLTSIIPATTSSATWVALGTGGNLGAVSSATDYGWPIASGTAADKPWGGTTVVGTAQLSEDLNNEFVSGATAIINNNNVRLAIVGYGMTVKEYLTGPFGSNTTLANSAGFLQSAKDSTDADLNKVVQLLEYAASENNNATAVLEELFDHEFDRIASLLKETQAAVAGGKSALVTAARTSIVTMAYNTGKGLSEKLMAIFKASDKDIEHSEIGTMVVGWMTASSGVAVPSGADYTTATFKAALHYAHDLSLNLPLYAGSIWKSIEAIGDATQKANAKELFAAAIMQLSADDLDTMVANANVWNKLQHMASADQVTRANLSGIVMPVYAESKVNADGLTVEHTDGFASLPSKILNKF